MKKEGSKREQGPTFCFDFWVRFGDHIALNHIPIVIIPTLKFTFFLPNMNCFQPESGIEKVFE